MSRNKIIGVYSSIIEGYQRFARYDVHEQDVNLAEPVHFKYDRFTDRLLVMGARDKAYFEQEWPSLYPFMEIHELKHLDHPEYRAEVRISTDAMIEELIKYHETTALNEVHANLAQARKQNKELADEMLVWSHKCEELEQRLARAQERWWHPIARFFKIIE